MAGHAFGRGNILKIVEPVADFGFFQQHALVGVETRFEGTVVDFAQVLVVNGLADELPLRDETLGAHVRTGDGEPGVADGVVEVALDALEDGIDRMGGLSDVDDLALAYAGRGNRAKRDDADATGAFRFADGELRAGSADLKRGDGVF